MPATLAIRIATGLLLLAAGNASGAQLLLVPGRDCHEPVLDVDAAGVPAMAWLATTRDNHPGGSFDEIWTAERSGGNWTSLTAQVEGGMLFGPRLAHTPSGERWLAWTEHDGNDSRVWVRRIAGGSPAQFAFGSPVEPDLEVDIAAFGSDSLVVVWQGWRSSDYDIFLAVGNADGFSPPMRISPCIASDREPRLAVGGGKAWIVWSAYEGPAYNLHHRTWDPSGGLSAPVRLTNSTAARNLHPELHWEEAGQRLWVSHLWVEEGWPGFNIGEPGPNDMGSPRVFAFDGTQILRPLGLDAVKRPPLPAMEDLGFDRYVYYGTTPMPDRFGTGVNVLVDGAGRLRTYHKQIGSLVNGSVRNVHWGFVEMSYEDGAWAGAPTFVQAQSSLGWETPAAAAAGDSVWTAWSTDLRNPPIYPSSLNLFGIEGRMFAEARAVSPAPPMQLVADGLPEPVPDCPAPDTTPTFTVPSPEGTRALLWGDTHRHSVDLSWDAFSDPPFEDTMMYSLDWLDHDWIAPSDHVERFSPLLFACVRRFAHLYDIPGRFRVLAGAERSMRGGIGGDQNTVFRDPEDFREAAFALPGTDSWHDLYDALAGKDVLCIPHTTAQCGGSTDWEHLAQGDPSTLPAPLRLVEVYQSARGSFEYPGCPQEYTGCSTPPDSGWVNVALSMGMRVGLISSSDHTIRAAFGGVFATDRSRDAIWQALHDRHAMGTSRTVRAGVDFRVNGALMGSEIESGGSPRISVRVESPVELAEIRIVRNGDPDWRVLPVTGTTADVELLDDDPGPAGTSSVYYARVADADSSYHYTSPVWVDLIGQATDVPEPSRAGRLSLTASPNPSRGAVRFSLPWIPSAGASLRVHDVTGRLVRELRLSTREGAWDGRDRHGKAVAAGRYYGVVQAAGETALTSFVLLK